MGLNHFSIGARYKNIVIITRPRGDLVSSIPGMCVSKAHFTL